MNSAYDWNTAMGGVSNTGLMGSWFNPLQTQAAALPAASAMTMPTSAMDLSWSMPGAVAPQPGMNLMGLPAPNNPAPAATGGGFMNTLRGQPGVAGDGITGWLGDGRNLSTVVNGIGALTGAWLGYQNLKVAKDQLGFQRDSFAKNYGNQVKSYNTSLEDRIRGRTADYAGKESDVQAYLDKNKLG